MKQYDEAAVLAGLAQLRATEEQAAPAAAPPKADPATEQATAAQAAPAQPEDVAAPEPAKAEPVELDPETSKRLARLQQQEARIREQSQAERRKLEEERAAFAAERRRIEEQQARIERLTERAKYDPAGVLAEFGLTADDYETAAKQIYGLSKAAAADPKNRDAAARMMREKETVDTVGQLRRELDEMRAHVRAQAEQAEQARVVEEYRSKVTKSVSEATPLVRTMLEKNPARAWDLLAAEAVAMANELGEVPDAIDVVARAEKRRREELAELGIEIPTKKALPSEQAPARTGAMPTTSAPTQPTPNATPKKSLDERIAAAVSGLRQLRQEQP